MTTSSMAPHRLRRGCTFYPQQNELTDLYLRSKIVGEALPGDTVHFIHVADVYSAEPEKLAEKFHKAPGTGQSGIHKQPVWYFFSTVRVGEHKRNAHGGAGRKARTIDGEAGKHWHSEGGEKPVKGGSAYGGYQQKFSYMVRNASTGKNERAGWIMAEYGISPEHGGGHLVLCEIHPSPRTPVLSDGSKKRKVAADEHVEDPRATARPRHMVDLDQEEQDSWSKIYEPLPPCNYYYDQEVDAQPQVSGAMDGPGADLAMQPCSSAADFAVTESFPLWNDYGQEPAAYEVSYGAAFLPDPSMEDGPARGVRWKIVHST